jgi:putative ABC transport system permease protein
MTPTPPRLALWVLEHRVPENELEFVRGDLEERFLELARAGGRGEAAARRWFWRQSLSLAVRRWPGARRSTQPTGGDSWLTKLARDFRYGIRIHRRAPLFAALVVMTLAVGLGATAAIFSVLNPILLQGAPYPDAGRLTMVWQRDQDGTTSNLGWLTFHDIERESRTLGPMAVMSYWTPMLYEHQGATRLSGQRVSHRFFSTLGVSPELGRDFTAEEDHSETRRVVILSHGLWQSAFGGDSGIVGKTITLSERSYRVVGVMPRRFESVLAPSTTIWSPLGYEETDPWACRTCGHLRMIARLRNGVSPEEASGELENISEALVRANPTEYPVVGLPLMPLNTYLTAGVRPALLATAGAVALLLLIACVNVTNLFLGRTTRRAGEFAVRTALGAGTWPLVRQVLAEAVVLALTGGVLAVGLGSWALKALLRLAPPGLPRLDQVSVDWRVLCFTLLVATAAGIVAGLAPALAALHANLGALLRQGGRTIVAAGHRIRTALVVAEVALALVLLTGAGLLLRSMDRLLAVDPGFNPDKVATLELEAFGNKFDSAAVLNTYYHTVIERVGGLPGVSAVAATSQLPLSGDFDSWGVHMESHPAANPAEDPSAFRFGVTPGYMHAMRIPILKGRDFAEADAAGAPPVMLINTRMARKLFPGEEAVGQRIKIGGTDGPSRTIVGVVGNVQHQSLDAEDEMEMYVPEGQMPRQDYRMVLVVRGATEVGKLLPSVRAAIQEVDPGVAIVTVSTMDEQIRTRTAIRRFALAVFQVFAGAAVLLAALGLYGVLSGSVSERTREIGIRSALGAQRRQLLALVVRHALALTLLGMGIGLVGALFLTDLLRSLLFEISPNDPTTFLVVALLLIGVALAAAGMPAWRAARVEPAEALRGE